MKKRKRTEGGAPSLSVEEVAPEKASASEHKEGEALGSSVEASGGVEDPTEPHAAAALAANTHWLTRIIFIRSLAFVYCECMHAAAHQARERFLASNLGCIISVAHIAKPIAKSL